MEDALSRQFTDVKRELKAYLCRLVVRPQVADDLLQTTFLRCLEASDRLPDSDEGVRGWLFKVASNLAIDELRRHSTWRETMILDLRDVAEADRLLVEKSVAMIGSPETKAIAREHLVACLACTLRNLPEKKAATLLLKEIHAFTIEEIADMLDATPAQAKNWLQEARSYMAERYGSTCALTTKNGVCHQCVELDGFFSAGQRSPLAGTSTIEDRLKIASELAQQPWGPWHRMMLELIDEVI